MIAGRYFDGLKPSSSEATLTRVADQVVVSLSADSSDQLQLPLDQVEISDEIAGVPRRIQLGAEGHFETRDQAAVNELFEITGPLSWVARLEGNPRAILMTLTGLSLFALLSYFVLLPGLAHVIAGSTPQVLKEGIDQSSLSMIEALNLIKDSELSEDQLGELQPLLDELTERYPELSLEFRVVSSPIGANAFALPGGSVIITDELIKVTSLEQLRAVLYHEVGHVELNHGLKMIIERAGVSLFLLALLGFDDLNALPQVLLVSSYSRGAEREADQYAAQLLRAEGLSPKLLVDALRAMVKSSGVKEQTSSIWSSHPLNDERAAYLLGEGR